MYESTTWLIGQRSISFMGCIWLQGGHSYNSSLGAWPLVFCAWIYMSCYFIFKGIVNNSLALRFTQGLHIILRQHIIGTGYTGQAF